MGSVVIYTCHQICYDQEDETNGECRTHWWDDKNIIFLQECIKGWDQLGELDV